MDNKKLKARLEMLKKISKDKHSELNSGIGDGLKSKKVSKVEVIAKDEKGLAEGLSKAQQILKAKLGDKFEEASDSEESSEESEDECEACEGEGCEHCEEDDSEELVEI